MQQHPHTKVELIRSDDLHGASFASLKKLKRIFFTDQVIGDPYPFIYMASISEFYKYSDSSGKYVLPLCDIVRFEAVNNYTVIHVIGKRQFTLSKCLCVVEEEIKAHNKFFRIHRSHIINGSHFSSLLKKDGGSVVLKDGTNLQLARRRKREFIEFVDQL